MLRAKFTAMTREEYLFGKGLIGGQDEMATSLEVEADTPEKLIDEICAYFLCDPEDISLNCFGEAGRIDISLIEDANGGFIGDVGIEKWKRGEIRAWYVNYTGYVYQTAAYTMPHVEGCDNWSIEGADE